MNCSADTTHNSLRRPYSMPLDPGHWRQAGQQLRALLAPERTEFQNPMRGALELARAAMPRAHRTYRRVRGDESVYARSPVQRNRHACGPDRRADV